MKPTKIQGLALLVNFLVVQRSISKAVNLEMFIQGGEQWHTWSPLPGKMPSELLKFFEGIIHLICQCYYYPKRLLVVSGTQEKQKQKKGSTIYPGCHSSCSATWSLWLSRSSGVCSDWQIVMLCGTFFRLLYVILWLYFLQMPMANSLLGLILFPR